MRGCGTAAVAAAGSVVAAVAGAAAAAGAAPGVAAAAAACVGGVLAQAAHAAFCVWCDLPLLLHCSAQGFRCAPGGRAV